MESAAEDAESSLAGKLNLAALREEYVSHGLRRAELDRDPIRQFAKWFGEAAAGDIRDVNAMNLATVNAEGVPCSRVVLLKAMSDRGFVFYTNYTSAKAREIEANPRVALNFFWVQLSRQVRINGTAERTSREESEEYFHSRPVGSQLGAWASNQSEVIPNRDVLEAKLVEVTDRFGGGVIPLPPNWGGYRVVPATIEFWQGRTNRLHDRFRYTRQADDTWLIERLSP
ncbi:MAG TPA: pyridoxamine 5'-phosphate oxidase [Chthoniobacterales bacterium]|nr:pyridoxamine 5'-phosphate oxidase [Chthoniobacterales bacterium]